MWFTCESHVKFKEHMWFPKPMCLPCDMFITWEISHLKFHMWNFTCEITCDMFLTCEISHVKFLLGNFTCDMLITCEISLVWNFNVAFHMWFFWFFRMWIIAFEISYAIRSKYTVSQLNWYFFCFGNKSVNFRNISIKFYRLLDWYYKQFAENLIITIIIIIWFGDTVTVSHSTKCDTNSKVRALSWVC